MLTSNYEVLGTKKNLNRMLSGSLDDWPSFFAVNMARGTVTVSVERDYVTLAEHDFSRLPVTSRKQARDDNRSSTQMLNASEDSHEGRRSSELSRFHLFM